MEHPQLPSQKKKLEWVTPKILLMEAGDTDGKQTPTNRAETSPKTGPS
jgi:hypothetical protein